MSVDSLAIYVSSFDGCSDLWYTFFLLFDRFWADSAFPIFLINNEKVYVKENVNVMNTGPEVHWFSRTIRSLKQINQKYILFMLEDYYISKKVNNSDFFEIIDFMEKEKVFYYQLSIGNTKSKQPVHVNVSATTNYPISLQPAIWDRQELVRILEEIDGKALWDVENYHINKYKGKTGSIPGAYHDTRDLLGYKNGVLRGKWILDTIKYYKRLGFVIDTGNREVMSNSKMLKYRIAAFTNSHVPSIIKKPAKAMLKAIHFDYLR